MTSTSTSSPLSIASCSEPARRTRSVRHPSSRGPMKALVGLSATYRQDRPRAPVACSTSSKGRGLGFWWPGKLGGEDGEAGPPLHLESAGLGPLTGQRAVAHDRDRSSRARAEFGDGRLRVGQESDRRLVRTVGVDQRVDQRSGRASRSPRAPRRRSDHVFPIRKPPTHDRRRVSGPAPPRAPERLPRTRSGRSPAPKRACRPGRRRRSPGRPLRQADLVGGDEEPVVITEHGEDGPPFQRRVGVRQPAAAR